jgi:predicted RNA-binding Zn-ribbon protein involved in translation (DUF1610 family)
MKTEEMRLDGNAVAGMLDEVLRVEATTVIVRCGSCGSENALGAAVAYVQCPGAVLRCPGCDEVLMRFAQIREHLVADMRGVGRLTI